MKFRFSSCFYVSPDAEDVDGAETGGVKMNQKQFQVYAYKEMKSATNGFNSSNKVGQGGFGSVYKGKLRDGSLVAIKVLSVELESLRGEREFVSEITALSDIKHRNLVTLRGCCIEGTDRFLVYDYMENNSLMQTLLGDEQNRKRFNWEARTKIVTGIARALAYLHEEVVPYIVHRDIKASNILLDRNFEPKVSDFGLSRFLQDNKTHLSTRVAGTLGYLAPEYAFSGRLRRKSDVYSFGVLLLEIVSGRRVYSFECRDGDHLVQKVWEANKEEKLAQIIDPVLGTAFPIEEAVRLLKVGLLCVQGFAKLRPKMSLVVRILSREVNVEDYDVSQPGLIANLMDILIDGRKSNQSTFSKESSSPYTSYPTT